MRQYWLSTSLVLSTLLSMIGVSAQAQLILNEANAVGVNTDVYLETDTSRPYEGYDFGTYVPYSGNTAAPLTGNPYPADLDAVTAGNQNTLPNGWDGSTGWARVKFNGGDWWELVITEDHTDLRGYTLYWENDDDSDSAIGEDGDNRGMVRFTNDRSFADLRAGTIVTMSEDSVIDEIRDIYPDGPEGIAETDTGHDYDLSTDTGFDPFDGANDWNRHYHVNEGLTDVGTATQYFEGFSNIKVDNDEWRFAIFDATSNLTFSDVESLAVPRTSLDLSTGLVQDFVGESAAGWGDATGSGGVNNQEIIALLGDPDNPTEGDATYTDAVNFYEDLDWSSFGSPNVYNLRPGSPEDLTSSGEDDDAINGVQDFSGMRDPVQANTYDFAAAGTASFTAAGSWELANDNSAAGTGPASTWTARVLNSGASDVTATVDANTTVAFVEAGATGAGAAVIEVEGGVTLSSDGRALIDDGGVLKIELDGDVDGQGKLEAVGNVDLFAGAELQFEVVGEADTADLLKAGDYTIVESTGGDLQGVFASVAGLGAYDGGVTYNGDSAVISVLYDILAGDFNLDGAVNGTDFSILSGNFNQAGSWANGDANGDGIVNGTDFSILSGNFNVSVSSSANAVPEPSAAVLGLIVVGTFGAARRNRR